MTARSICVCIPTYNEAENLERLVHAVFAASGRLNVAATLLVIDDNSPDGTGMIADRLAEADPRVTVLHRAEKSGIGPAYVAGFAYATAQDVDAVLQMDCDFSHDPADIGRLVAGLENADLVLGSRYVGGGAVKNWPLRRRLISRGGCWYARTVLGVDIRDLTGGFKCFRREALTALLIGDSRVSGYGFQIEMTYRALRAGMRVLEVPITFCDRTSGSSKMGPGIAFEAARKVIALRRSREAPIVPKDSAGAGLDRLASRPQETLRPVADQPPEKVS